MWHGAEGNHRVQVVNQEGLLVRSLGSKQPQHASKVSDPNIKTPPLGNFLRPRNILSGPGGIVLVSDHVPTPPTRPTPTALHPTSDSHVVHASACLRRCLRKGRRRLVLALIGLGWS